MSRSTGRLGWSDQDTLDAAELNLLIPYQQVYFPANMMVPGAIQPSTFQTLQINAQQSAIDVQEFPVNVNTECYWTWAFRGLPIDLTTPQFILAPEFFQTNSAGAPAPAEYAYMEFSIGVAYEDTSIDYTMEGAAEVAVQCLIPAAWDIFMTTTTGNKGVAVPQLFGQAALSGSNFNFLRFEIERFGTSANDTFDDADDSVYLKGCILQYKTDFNNIAVFPT